MICPRCGYDLDPALVAIRGKAQQIVRWTEIPRRGLFTNSTKSYDFFTESIPILIVKEVRNYETIPLPARNNPVPALQENIPANRRSQMPVLPETTRQPTGEIIE